MEGSNNSGSNNSNDGLDKHYVGNIWGWKFSFLGLFLILALAILMAIRYANLPPEERNWTPEIPENHHPFHKNQE